ncbi:MAG: hypothetical protein V1728_04185 [Candidatus Micrarchaeota archaeon]
MLRNPFAKAAVLTIIVVGLALIAANALDSMRSNDLKQTVERISLQNQETQVISHYDRVMARNTSEECPYLLRLREKELSQTYTLAPKISEYEQKNLFNAEYQQIRSQYLLGLADAYVTSFEAGGTCNLDEKPVAFFFRSPPDCPECVAQGKILDSVVPRCSNVRVYAMPTDSGLEPVNIIVDRYNISSEPTLIINDKTRLTGLQGEDEILRQLKAAGANCS